MADFTITFLGTGTSHGIPVIGCDCEVCTSPDPRDNRTRCSIYVETPEAAWVIDTGPDFRGQCLREGVKRLDTVLYTHAHTDHVMGFDDLRRFCDVLGGPIPVHASKDTLDKIRHSFAFAFQGMQMQGYTQPDPHEIEGPFFIGKTRVVPVPLEHGRTLVTGYLFEREGRRLLAYLTDCKIIPSHSLELVAGVEILVIDALRERPHPTHMHFEEAMRAASEIGAKRTFFTHLCHDFSHVSVANKLPEGIAPAYDGLRVAL